MKPFSTLSISLGIIVATFIARRGMRRKSLSTLGAATAWIVGFLSISCGARGFVLLMFYQVRKRRGSRELLFVWFTDEEFIKKKQYSWVLFLSSTTDWNNGHKISQRSQSYKRWGCSKVVCKRTKSSAGMQCYCSHVFPCPRSVFGRRTTYR